MAGRSLHPGGRRRGADDGRLGGSSSQSPALSDLAQNQDAYVGKTVSTSGTVERQRNANRSVYYVLTDARQDLVIIQPAARAIRFVGQAVAVTGRFEVDPRVGRLIRLKEIKRASS